MWEWLTLQEVLDWEIIGSSQYIYQLKKYEKNYIKVDNKDKKPSCKTGDTKKTFVNVGTNNTTGRVNFLTGTGKRKKYLGVVVKWKIKTLDLP